MYQQLGMRNNFASMKPFLSIIIPTYNSENYIVDLLNSINLYCQSLPTEIILVDDGSTDLTVPKVQKVALKENILLHIVEQNHRGASSARNNGILKANGQYIMFCDSDDMIISKFENEILFGVKNKVDILSFSDKVKSKKTFNDNDSMDELMISMLLGNCEKFVANEYTMGPYSKLIRRKFLLEHNIHFLNGIKWWEDLLFNLSCLCDARSITLVNNKIYYRRFNQGSISHNVDENCINTSLNVLEQSRYILSGRNKKERILKQERLFLLLSLLGSFFVFHHRKVLYNKFISNIGFNGDFIKLSSNFHSKIIIWSLLYFGFEFTVTWYGILYKLKNIIRGVKV